MSFFITKEQVLVLDHVLDHELDHVLDHELDHVLDHVLDHELDQVLALTAVFPDNVTYYHTTTHSVYFF